MSKKEDKKAKSKEESVGSFVSKEDLERIEKEKRQKEAGKLLAESMPTDAPLFKKLDALIEAVNGASHQLCRIADKMSGVETKSTATVTPSKESSIPKEDNKNLIKGDVMEAPTNDNAKEPPTPQPPDDVSAVMDLFPNDLASKLKFSKKEDGDIKVAPKQFLGSENFAKIASIIRAVGGDYVSAGKDSHFLVSPHEGATTDASPATPKGKTDEIKSKFPPVLADLLTFTEKDGMIVVKARQFLGSDNFAEIARIVRDIGGDYISAGKDSRFEVPIK